MKLYDDCLPEDRYNDFWVLQNADSKHLYPRAKIEEKITRFRMELNYIVVIV